MVSQTGSLDREGQAQPPGGLYVNRVANLAFLLALIHQSTGVEFYTAKLPLYGGGAESSPMAHL